MKKTSNTSHGIDTITLYLLGLVYTLYNLHQGQYLQIILSVVIIALYRLLIKLNKKKEILFTEFEEKIKAKKNSEVAQSNFDLDKVLDSFSNE